MGLRKKRNRTCRSWNARFNVL